MHHDEVSIKYQVSLKWRFLIQNYVILNLIKTNDTFYDCICFNFYTLYVWDGFDFAPFVFGVVLIKLNTSQTSRHNALTEVSNFKWYLTIREWIKILNF